MRDLDPYAKLVLCILKQAVADATAIGKKAYKEFQPGVTLTPAQLEEEKQALREWVFSEQFFVFCKYLTQDPEQRRQEILDLLEGCE